MAAIRSVKRWSEKGEVRVYVETVDGREGCRYVTGNHFQAKGTVSGDLTEEEWANAKQIGYNTVTKRWESWSATNPRPSEMRNKRPGPCARCGRMVQPGNKLYQVFDDEEDRMRWVVEHLDGNVCEANLAADKAAAERKRAYQEHMVRFRQMFATAEYPAGDHSVQGRIILDTMNIYGGGDLIVDDGQYIWFISNNGMDGDDWSRNNVRTGGAGAIGRRFPRTDALVAEAEELEAQRLAAKGD